MNHINPGDTAFILLVRRARGDHDAGPRLLLRRARAAQERHHHHDAELRLARRRHPHLDRLRLQPGLRTRRPRRHRQPALRLPEQRRPGAQPAVRADRALSGLLRLPAHRRGPDAGADHRRLRRPRAVQELHRLPHGCGACWSTCRSPTGSGAAAFCSSGACSTSAAAWSCTRAPALPRSPRSGWSASASSPPARRSARATSRSSPSASGCCGSAGWATTRPAPCAPTASPRRPSSTPSSPAASRCSSGCSPTGCVPARPAWSAP